MQAALRKIGNSTGIVIPRVLLGQIGLEAGAALDIRVEDGRLIGEPIRSDVRAGWAEAAAAVAASEEDPDEAAWEAFGNDADGQLSW